MSHRVLFAAAEAVPLSKTGGLADVAHALPRALHALGHDSRVVTPAYRGTRERLVGARRHPAILLRGMSFTIWEGFAEAGGPLIWLVDCPELFLRDGAPYTDALGREYPDNAWRFGLFGELVALLAGGRAGIAWLPEIVHLNDWHTGLAAVWLTRVAGRPGIVYTIHNLAYQGNFPRADFDRLGLPPELWYHEALEFYGQFSFMKAGLVMADALTTVSPTYAREIQTPAFGERMDGVLRRRAESLTGIANGIDVDIWNPATDPHLAHCYDATSVMAGKRANKAALQRRLGLVEAEDVPLLGLIGRLAWQKGADLVLQAAPWIEEHGIAVAMVGSGDRASEQAFADWTRRLPGQVAARIGYDESLAHLIEAGADFFLMPSRYEPCGLNQMYGQRYGTVPVARRTGGLADTVVDASATNLADGTATGVLFDYADVSGVTLGLTRALELMRDPQVWSELQLAGMRQDFSWVRAAREYVTLFERVGT